MNSIILAVVATLSSDVSPHWVAAYPDEQSCLKAAQVANANDPRLKAPEMVKFGPKYLCLKAVPEA